MSQRLFVAVWLPGEAREEAERIRRRLAAAEPSLGWVAPENLHVTLAFLGDVEPDRIADLTERIGQALRGAAPFTVQPGSLGTFPAAGRVRVVWLGLEVGTEEIAALASRLSGTLVAGSYMAPPDRPFTAHVTLGRPKGARGSGRLGDLLSAIRPCGGAGRIEEVTLVESRLTPRGSHYEVLARFPLAGNAGDLTTPREGDRA